MVENTITDNEIEKVKKENVENEKKDRNLERNKARIKLLDLLARENLWDAAEITLKYDFKIPKKLTEKMADLYFSRGNSSRTMSLAACLYNRVGLNSKAKRANEKAREYSEREHMNELAENMLYH